MPGNWPQQILLMATFILHVWTPFPADTFCTSLGAYKHNKMNAVSLTCQLVNVKMQSQMPGKHMWEYPVFFKYSPPPLGFTHFGTCISLWTLSQRPVNSCLGPWVICEYKINHFTLLCTHSKEKEAKKNGNHWNTCAAGTRPGRPGTFVANIDRARIL